MRKAGDHSIVARDLVLQIRNRRAVKQGEDPTGRGIIAPDGVDALTFWIRYHPQKFNDCDAYFKTILSDSAGQALRLAAAPRMGG